MVGNAVLVEVDFSKAEKEPLESERKGKTADIVSVCDEFRAAPGDAVWASSGKALRIKIWRIRVVRRTRTRLKWRNMVPPLTD